jgi:hypothetical protein
MRLQRLYFLILPLLALPAYADSFTLGTSTVLRSWAAHP